MNAYLAMIVSVLFFTIMLVCVRLVGETVPLGLILFSRSLLGLLMLSIYFRLTGTKIYGRNKVGLILRAVFGCGAMICYFYAITKIELANAAMLNYTAPIFVTIFATLFLKEKITSKVIFALPFAMLGVFFIIRPDSGIIQTGAIVGLISGILAGAAFTMVSYVKRTDSLMTIVYYFSLISAVMTFPIFLTNIYFPTIYEFLLLIAVALTATLGQIFMTSAYRTGIVSPVSVVSLLTVVMAWGIGYLGFDETLSVSAISGIALVIISIFVCTTQKEPEAEEAALASPKEELPELSES